MTLNDVINFIKSNFKEVNNNSTNLQNFKKLIEFLNKNNITLSIDDCNSLLQLKSFKNAITLISNDTDLDRILSDSEEDSIKNFYINLKICLDNELIDNIQGNDIIRDYLMQIKKIPMLSEEEKKTLPPLIKQGDEKAINRYVEANLRLVVSVAKRYKDKGYPFMDLIGEGNIGLIKAVKNFDYDKGFAFSTYAYQCIRVSIFSYMSDQYTLFKISKDTISDLMKLKKAADKTNLILDLNNKEPINELSKETGFEPSYIEFLIKFELTNTVSLDSYINSTDNDGTKLIDMIPDEEIDFELNPFLKDFSKDFDNSSLKDKYKEVLKLRSGFYGKCYSLKEIGKTLNMSTEAVRNREIKALRLARHNEDILKYSSNGKW